jgi:hypothetical protein
MLGGRCEEIIFHLPGGGGGETMKGEGRCLVAWTWPDWPGGTVSLARCKRCLLDSEFC